MHTATAGAAAASIRDLSHDADVDKRELLRTTKGRVVPGVVEAVRGDAGSLRVYLPESQAVVSLILAGVACPRIPYQPRAEEGKAAEPAKPTPPFAEEAKFFSEVRILHRDVGIRLGGCDKYDNLVGDVEHPLGNVAVELLKAGLGRVSWSASYTTRSNAAALRAAETQAKKARLRVWRDHVPRARLDTDVFAGVVVEVHSGDTVSIAVDGGDAVRRVSLASTRCPRMGNARRGAPPAPLAWESRDHLRAALIGKTVNVTVDYSRESDSGDKREYATIVWKHRRGPRNAAVDSIKQGLAEVVRHRPDDDRASAYDEMLDAEASAKEAKRGLHGKAARDPPKRINDLSYNAATRAREMGSSLTRARALKGVVDYVYSGSRVKLYLPSENALYNLAFVGIKAPQTPSRDGTGGQPFGVEAQQMTYRLLMQREVDVQVETVDRGGNLIGTLTVKGINPSLELLAAGLARVVGFSAERSPHFAALTEAEAGAKAARLGVWEDYVEPEDEEDDGPGVPEPESKSGEDEEVAVRISDIRNGGHFFVHAVGDPNLAKVEARMRALTDEVGSRAQPLVEPRSGTLCAALFEEDSGAKVWNRVRIVKMNVRARGDALVQFLDYGNTAVLPASRLRPLDASFFAIPPQARECKLAFVRAEPTDDPSHSLFDAAEEAAYELHSLAWGKELRAVVHRRDRSNVLHVSLYAGSEDSSINLQLTAAGFVRLALKADLPPPGSKYDATVAAIREAEQKARSLHIGIFTNGDPGDEDDPSAALV
eukprot:PLAT15503.2.p1 GENE.PLAT15503.2~~PLAT15503.2.p1  ORF type:complete len:768 (+),score=424.10 PLAT15503.2:465-2768(+)